VRYQPRPIDPSIHPAAVRARDLGDSALRAVVARYAGAPEGRRWNDHQLAVAALTLRSDLPRRRSEWKAARAGLRRAGERPRPGLSADVERRVSGRRESAPWVVSLTGMFALELGGKRGARLQAARARTALAESRLLADAWGTVGAVRRATGMVARSSDEVAGARAEVRLLEQVHQLERARYAEAALGASELARTATETQAARLALAEAERGALESRAGLAATLAVSVRAVDSIEPVLGPADACAWVESVGTDSLAALALARRQEVAVALGEYALAESDLRLQVARQYPDLELGPGFIWDQGVNRWTLALALPALLGGRNRGAIGEAEMNREVAGLAVAEAQDAVLADVETAAQVCRGGGLELAAADSLVAAAGRLLERDSAAYQRGETTRLEPARAELQLARAERARRGAERRLALASIDLERAVGAPLGGGPRSWPDPRRDPEEEASRQ
jgi:outer membrane protein TolC